MRCCAALLVSLSIGISPLASAPVRISVDSDTAYAINGRTRIQSAVFGLSAYEGATFPVKAEYAPLLRQAGVACLGFPGVIGWCAPRQMPEGGPAAIERWYASDEALHEITWGEPLDGARYMYGRILPACRKLGIEPMVYITGGPDWVMGEHQIPKDNKLYGVVAANYVALLRRIDPSLRWVHLLNEPNSHWFKGGKSGKDYAEMFRTVAAAIKRRNPGVMVGGPVLCWPPAWPPAPRGMSNWYTWDGYTMPLLNIAGEELDFFDFHYYGLDVDVAAEEVQTVENALILRRGRRVPVAITECGTSPGELTERQWADPAGHYMIKTLGMQRLLMMYLDRPATVMTVQMHDLSAMAGRYLARFIKGPDPYDQLPTYWMYSLWRHFRGIRLCARVEPGPVRAMAAFDGSEVVVMVFNDSPIARDIELKLTAPEHPGVCLPDVARWASLSLNEKRSDIVRRHGEGTCVKAPPYSTYVFRFRMPEGWDIRAAAERVELVGDAVMQEFTAVGDHRRITVSVPDDVLKGARSARVRVGLLGSNTGDRLAMTIGGRRYRLRAGTYFQEIPLRAMPGPGRNVVDFHLQAREGTIGERTAQGGENRLRVSSISLIIERSAR